MCKGRVCCIEQQIASKTDFKKLTLLSIPFKKWWYWASTKSLVIYFCGKLEKRAATSSKTAQISHFSVCRVRAVTASTGLWARLHRWPRPTPARAWRWEERLRWASSAGGLRGRRSWSRSSAARRQSEEPGRDWTRRLACRLLRLLRRCWFFWKAERSEAWCREPGASVPGAPESTLSPGTLQTSLRRTSWALGHWWVSEECSGRFALLGLPASLTSIQ